MMCEQKFEVSVCQAVKGVRGKDIQGRGNSESKDMVARVIHHCQGDSPASRVKIQYAKMLSKNVLNEQVSLKDIKKSSWTSFGIRRVQF